MDEHLTPQELIQRFATIQNISVEEAQELIGAETEEEILSKIHDYTTKRISETFPPMNRAQRRAFKKKTGKTANVIAETAKKLTYIDLIQKMRNLNKEKENEDTSKED